MDALFLSNTSLFRGITPEEVTSMLGCLLAEEKCYQKDEVISPEIIVLNRNTTGYYYPNFR